MESVVSRLDTLQDADFLNGLLLRLPHGHPDLLIDRITYLEVNKFIASLKNITRSEIPAAGAGVIQYYPNTLILESLIQTCFILVAQEHLDIDHAAEKNLLSGLKNVDFHNSVTAGDQLFLTAEVVGKKPYLWTLEARAATEECLVAEAIINFKNAS